MSTGGWRAAVVLAAALIACGAQAQSTVTVHGRVVDQNGRAVEQATEVRDAASSCGAGTTGSAGEGIVYGRVRSSGVAASASAATVEITWTAATDSAGKTARVVRRSVQTDTAGAYAICAMPNQQTLTLSATGGGAATVPVSFRVGATGVARRDITIPTFAAIAQAAADSSAIRPLRGADGAAVDGVAVDSAGQPLRDARITVSGVIGEWRTDGNGRFSVRGIPPGTRVIAATELGFEPERRLVDVASHDSAFLELSMSRLVTKLKVVTVQEREHHNALKFDLDQRRRAGFGYRTDSAELARLPGVGEAFNFPGVHAAFRGGQFSIYMTGVYSMTSKGGSGAALSCNPTIWIDGAISDIAMLNDLHKDEIALIEVYSSAARTPMQFAGTRNLCGVVLVWRKSYISP